MGATISQADYEYIVKTVTNVTGDVVYAFDTNGDGTFYNQPDLTFAVGSTYLFDTSQIASGYTLSFGTTVDGTPDTSVVTSGTNQLLLDLTAQTGNHYTYFDATNAGMGYVSASGTAIEKVVTVANGVFNIDNVARPLLTFTSGDTYVFDQSDSSNAGHILVIGTTIDDNTTLVTQTVMGTPGQAGAYTSFTATATTVYYFCYNHSGMGNDGTTTIYFGDLITTATSGSDTGNASTSVINGNSQLNTVLQNNNFVIPSTPHQPLSTGSATGGYYYTHINFEGEGIQRPGGNAAALSSTYPDVDGFTKAIVFFYTQSPEGWIVTGKPIYIWISRT